MKDTIQKYCTLIIIVTMSYNIFPVLFEVDIQPLDYAFYPKSYSREISRQSRLVIIIIPH